MDKRIWRIVLPCVPGLVAVLFVLALAGCGGEAVIEQAQALRARGTQHTFHSEVVTNANGTAMWVDSYPTLGIQVVGITNATVSFVGTIDGSNWVAVEVVNVTTGAKATSTTADGIFRLPVGDIRKVRCPISSWVGGTITVKGNAPAEAGFGLEDVEVSSVTTGTIQVDDGGNVLSVDDGAGSLTVDDGATSLTVDGSVVVSSVTTGTIQVDDGGASLTVDGSVTVSSITTGTVSVAQIENALPTGGNTIGDVTVSDVTTGTIDVGAVSGTVTVDSELPAAAALADAAANPTVPTAGAAQMLYNATAVDLTWDRERNNWSEWPFPSLQRTASGSVSVENYNAKGAYIVVSITGIGVDQSLTVSASLYDYDGAGTEASDQQEVIWASAALTPAGRHTYLIYPGAGAAAQDVVATVSYPLPRLFRIGTVLNNSEPITFSVGVHYIN